MCVCIDPMSDSTLKNLYAELRRADSGWRQRRRQVDTTAIFSALCSGSLNRRGFEHIIEADGSNFTAQALGRARRKVPLNTFADINRSIQGVRSGRVYAIDGSKVHVHPSFVNFGCKSRTNGKSVSRPAVRPLVMLSSMLDVETRTCYDSIISMHFNERRSACEHFDKCSAGDTLIFDRGYYSSALLREGHRRGLRLLFRLKCDAFIAAKKFYKSPSTRRRVSFLQENGSCFDCYLIKYFIDGKTYMCITNFETTATNVKYTYAKRWRVETSFRRLKSDLNLECSHSMTPELYVQEVQARILLDTVSMTALPSMISQREDRLDKPKHKRPSYYTAVDRCMDIIYLMRAGSSHGCRWSSVRRMIASYHGPYDFSWIHTRPHKSRPEEMLNSKNSRNVKSPPEKKCKIQQFWES